MNDKHGRELNNDDVTPETLPSDFKEKKENLEKVEYKTERKAMSDKSILPVRKWQIYSARVKVLILVGIDVVVIHLLHKAFIQKRVLSRRSKSITITNLCNFV